MVCLAREGQKSREHSGKGCKEEESIGNESFHKAFTGGRLRFMVLYTPGY